MLGKNRSYIYLHMRICLSAKCLKACTYLKYGAEKPDTYIVNWAKCVFFILQSLRPATSSLQSLRPATSSLQSLCPATSSLQSLCVQLPPVCSLCVQLPVLLRGTRHGSRRLLGGDWLVVAFSGRKYPDRQHQHRRNWNTSKFATLSILIVIIWKFVIDIWLSLQRFYSDLIIYLFIFNTLSMKYRLEEN